MKHVNLSHCLDLACELGGNVVNFYLDGGGQCSDPATCSGDGQCWIMRCTPPSNITWTSEWFGADVFAIKDDGIEFCILCNVFI